MKYYYVQLADVPYEGTFSDHPPFSCGPSYITFQSLSVKYYDVIFDYSLYDYNIILFGIPNWVSVTDIRNTLEDAFKHRYPNDHIIESLGEIPLSNKLLSRLFPHVLNRDCLFSGNI